MIDPKIRTQVNVSVELLSVIDVDENGNQLRTFFKVHYEWNDPRMRYLNIDPGASMIRLSNQEMDQIWVPHIFLGDQYTYNREVISGPSVFLTKTQGVPSLSTPESLLKNNIFNGSTTNLLLSAIYRYKVGVVRVWDLTCRFQSTSHLNQIT